MKFSTKLFIPCLLTLFAVRTFASEEWTQFRGPNGTGVSATTGLPQEFGPNKNVVWKTDLPPGQKKRTVTNC
jgi:outer membrane protein assembly factor BamB